MSKYSIKQIFKDNWYSLLTTSPNVRNVVSEEVDKMLFCGDMSRENLTRIFLSAFPYIFLGLIILGLICNLWGGVKWYKIQKNLDESVQLDVDEKRYNYKKLTATEVAEKAIKDIIEIQDVNEMSNLSTQKQRIITGLQIENACFAYISDKLSSSYNVKQNVRVGRNEFDILAFSKRDNIDLLYEIKYWSNTNTYRPILFKTLERIKATRIDYENTAHRNFKFTLLIVSDSENIDIMKNILEQNHSNIDNEYSLIKIEIINKNELSIK